MWPYGNTQQSVTDQRLGGGIPGNIPPGKVGDRVGTDARPKVSSPTSASDCKLQFDSTNDSGFLSGSNLLSSSSIEPTEELSENPASPIRGGSSGTCIGRLPSLDSDLKSNTTESTELDSGIGISEQLSSLNLESHSSSDVSPAPSATRTINKTTPSAPTLVRKANLDLNEAQVTLLKEIFQRDEDGDTQLHVAVMRGFVEVIYHITRLLPHQAFLDLPNHLGSTALHLAVARGDAGVARHLVVCGASPVCRDRRGNTPLHSACAQGDANMVSQLTSPVKVVEVMHADLKYAPAHVAGLLSADLPNYEGQTCIHIAAHGGHQKILEHLTWYGADINAREGKSGRTAMHYAVERRDPSLVEFLATKCRANLTLETYAGLSPFQMAMANGADVIAAQLRSMGAPEEDVSDYLLDDDDLDYDDDPVEMSNGWGGIDDLKIGGVPVPSMAMAVPVSDSGPLNLEGYM